MRHPDFAHLAPDEYRGLCLYARRRILFRLKEIIGCTDCGYRKSGLALEWDHVRGEKLFNIATGTGRRWRSVLAELTKCDVRCSNCHRIITHERRDLPATGPRDTVKDDAIAMAGGPPRQGRARRRGARAPRRGSRRHRGREGRRDRPRDGV